MVMKTLLLARNNSRSTHNSSAAPLRLGPAPKRSAQSRVLGLIVLLGAAWSAQASDPIGMYAIVDKVVVEPSTGSPERLQVWGAFSVAEGFGYTYKKPEAGYLYYKLPEKKAEAARNEWADLKSVAGT